MPREWTDWARPNAGVTPAGGKPLIPRRRKFHPPVEALHSNHDHTRAPTDIEIPQRMAGQVAVGLDRELVHLEREMGAYLPQT